MPIVANILINQFYQSLETEYVKQEPDNQRVIISEIEDFIKQLQLWVEDKQTKLA